MPITDAWRAGYKSGQEPSNELLRAIEPPETYTDAERGEFISGFLSGARAARDRELIDGMTKAIAEEDAEIQDRIASDMEIEARLEEEDAERERLDNGQFGVGA